MSYFSTVVICNTNVLLFKGNGPILNAVMVAFFESQFKSHKSKLANDF